MVLSLSTQSAFGTSILWGIGDSVAGAKTTALYNDTPLRMVTQWYNGPQDMQYVTGYKNNSAISDLYGKGYAIQLIVWLADAPADYPTSAQFQTDLEELIKIFRGQGPHYGPLYVVLFTEIETYPIPAGYADWNAYRAALKSTYMTSINLIHSTYGNSHVGLGFGVYGWNSNYGTDRDLAYWNDALNASDYTCTQAMVSCNNVVSTNFAGKIRNAVRQLGDYGKPVMISHFKIWGNENYPDQQPDDQRAAFNTFMADMFTDSSLTNLVNDGLFGWGFMIDRYCMPPISGHDDFPEPGLSIYNTLDTFITNHNRSNPWFVGVNPPPATVTEMENVTTVTSSHSITNFSESAASMGEGEKLNAALNGWVSYTLNVPAGTYYVRVRTKRLTDRGIYKLDIDGVNLVTNKDTYNASSDYVIQNLPVKTFSTSGNKEFKFTVTGKNASSTGYVLALDCIQLVPVVWEAETVPNVLATDSVTLHADAGASGGYFEKLNSNAVNDYVTYTIPIWNTGTYDIEVRVRKQSTRGKSKLYINNYQSQYDYEMDQYSSGYEFYTFTSAVLGSKTFNCVGNKEFKFKVTNAGAGGDYTLVFDYIKLTPQ